jgi:DNA replication protein DnaC
LRPSRSSKTRIATLPAQRKPIRQPCRKDTLIQVVAACYEAGSIVISTNRTFREWGILFDVDNTLATALIERLMHHGEAIVIQGDSYRMRGKDSDSPSA